MRLRSGFDPDLQSYRTKAQPKSELEYRHQFISQEEKIEII
jgi:hypothetical protein